MSLLSSLNLKAKELIGKLLKVEVAE